MLGKLMERLKVARGYGKAATKFLEATDPHNTGKGDPRQVDAVLASVETVTRAVFDAMNIYAREISADTHIGGGFEQRAIEWKEQRQSPMPPLPKPED